ncbi:C1q-related factor-like [Ylistrum balloti]|uniref:C1q-related factor-like n=1 Tax=Ylistrum balloti TaxID=509963 RepID=UPI002905C7FD|nr:C1q-related factor-like [Ylistrum balloti]
MYWTTLFTLAITLAVSLVNGDKEKYSRYSPLPNPPPPPEKDDDATSGCNLKVECKNRKGEPGIPGLIGVPGLPGPFGFPGLKGQKGEQGTEELTRSGVSFFAALNENIGPLNGQVMKYDYVLLNEGSAYNSTSGKFTVPFSGVYVFNIVVAAQHGKSASVQLFQTSDGEDQVVVTVWSESIPNWSPSSNTVYLSLQQGQKVYLLANRDLNSYYFANMYTTFSGHML